MAPASGSSNRWSFTTPRYAVPGIETLQHVHHHTGFYPAVRIVAAGGRLYLTTGTHRVASTYAWTNGRLEPVLVEGDSLQFGNVAYTVASAALVNTSRDGAPLLRVETSQPRQTTPLAAKIGTRMEIGVVVRGGFVSSDAQRATFIVGMLGRVANVERRTFDSRSEYR